MNAPSARPTGRSSVSSVRLATIDLGTNTVRLLVADVEPGARGWRVVEADQQVTRLGEGLTATGHLAETAAARTATVVGEYVVRARRAGAERLAIVATSAVREAANGPAFAARVERATGERVTIVSGSEEAALTLAGVLEGLPGKTDAEKTLVFDIGGGSSEYILARGAAAIAEASLRLGVVDLTERYPFTDPVDWPRYRRMCAEIAERLQAGLPQSIRAGGVDRVVGTAGTATTLAVLDLDLRVYDPARVQGHVLSRADVERLLARLAALTLVERARLPCLEPGRADLIVPGTAIVLATLDLAAADRLVVSDWGLREGILVGLGV
jgi:exopolyphosphatase / guanosine-5'-triphosphate,3'-diphosphate pyrophosphatase